MNFVPFRKLMRVTVMIIAVAFLYNFFAWYLLFTSSRENKRLAEIVSLADNQRILGQRISTSSLLLLWNTGLTDTVSAEIHQKLQTNLTLFERQHRLLLQELNEADSTHKAGIAQLGNEVNIHSGNFTST